MKATPNVDFKTETFAVEIPAMKEAGLYKISLEEIIIDDTTVELNEVEKFVLHGEGQEDTICFMDQGGSDCKSTTTKDIAINDTDCKLYTLCHVMMFMYIQSEVGLKEAISCVHCYYFCSDETVLFSRLIYWFEEGGSDFDVCVMVVGESENTSCPVEFSIQITVIVTNLNGS